MTTRPALASTSSCGFAFPASIRSVGWLEAGSAWPSYRRRRAAADRRARVRRRRENQLVIIADAGEPGNEVGAFRDDAEGRRRQRQRRHVDYDAHPGGVT